MAVAASLCASAALAPAALAAQGDLPKLQQGAPTGITAGYFDDHSIGGDDHMGWGHEGSDPEALAIRFQSSLTNTGPGVLQVCANGSGQDWKSATQSAPANLGDCSGAAVNSGNLWFRYVVAAHDGSTTPAFNRWHLMDLQRFALVPLRQVNGQWVANTSQQTIWDSQWGDCLSLVNQYMDCELNRAQQSLTAGIASGATKVTQEGAPDATAIAFTSLDQIPSGRYQLVAIANPYGRFAESGTGTGSVNCTTIDITSDQQAGTFSVADSATQLGSCFLPQTIPAPVSGSAANDPLAGETVHAPCTLWTQEAVDATADPDDIAGHCWAHIPATDADLLTHPLARTNVTSRKGTPTTTDAIAVARGSVVHTPVTDPGNDDPGTTPKQGDTPKKTVVSDPPVQTPPTQPKALPAMTTRRARSYVRAALRQKFGTIPTTAIVSCRLTGGAASACTASWRRPGGIRYRGTLQVWFASDTSQVRWLYGMSVTRTKPGSVSRTYRRSNWVGGALTA
jgi:hypothetical protein